MLLQSSTTTRAVDAASNDTRDDDEDNDDDDDDDAKLQPAGVDQDRFKAFNVSKLVNRRLFVIPNESLLYFVRTSIAVKLLYKGC